MTAGHCSGGRDQEDCGWKPAQANSSREPISKKKILHKQGLTNSQVVECLPTKHEALSSNPSNHKKKKKQNAGLNKIGENIFSRNIIEN
jgi:hypothetical protein